MWRRDENGELIDSTKGEVAAGCSHGMPPGSCEEITMDQMTPGWFIASFGIEPDEGDVENGPREPDIYIKEIVAYGFKTMELAEQYIPTVEREFPKENFMIKEITQQEIDMYLMDRFNEEGMGHGDVR